MHQGLRRWGAALVLVAMAPGFACDGSSGADPTGDAADGGSSGAPRTIGGTVSGLAAGASVVLNSGGEALTLKANGPYVFATPVPSGATYEVTVGQQPAGQTCTVSHARDTVGSSDVTDVNVACAENAKRAVGGTLSGIIQSLTVTLQNNGGESLTLTADGAFTFPTRLAEGAPYSVTVTSLKIGPTPLPLEICPVTNGKGVVGAADVTNVVVACPGSAYKILYDFQGGADGALPRGELLEVAGTLFGTTSEGGAGNFGTIFKIGSDGTGYTRLLTFTGGADGAVPLAGLARDASGNFYGTTGEGGTGGVGTVFKLTPGASGAFTKTVLHHFGAGNDGRIPQAGLVLDGAGKLVGTTNAGGDGTEAGNGTIFRLSTDGSGYEVLHVFAGDDAGAGPQAKLTKDASGNLFGTTSSDARGTVYKLTPNGAGGYTHKVVFNFFGAASGSPPFGALVMDTAGNLFGTAYRGGAADLGLVYKLTPDGAGGYLHSVVLDLGDEPGSKPVAGLLPGKAGKLYGTTTDGASGGGALFALTPDGTGKYTEDVTYAFGQLSQTDGASSQAALVEGAQGKLYGTTMRGGTKNAGIVFRYAP